MKFQRGKSLKDPIYLKKDKNDFWMMGDIYEAACRCFDVIFNGRRNYFIESFSPKMTDFFTNVEYWACSITDKDGDNHSFILRVVEEVPGQNMTERTQQDSSVISDRTEETEKNEAVDSDEINAQEKTLETNDVTSDSELDVESILKEAKIEKEQELLSAELERENLLTNEIESDSIAATETKPEKKRNVRKSRKHR